VPVNKEFEMGRNPLTDEVLIELANLYEETGNNMSATARLLGLPMQTIQSRLKILEKRMGNKKEAHPQLKKKWALQRMHNLDIEGPCKILVGGDLHAWSGEPPLMWKAFCKIAKEIKPDAIVLLGDMIDAARVSRFGSNLNSQAPKVAEEIDTLKKWMMDLPPIKHRYWVMGNHDIRVDNYIANQASELDDYIGSLTQRFQDYTFGWAVTINGVEYRHRFKGGIHAGHNNVMHSGITMVTGHTHQLKSVPYRTRQGTFWGIEAGMLGNPNGPQFEYTEGVPTKYHSGFVVISHDEEGTMLPPENCESVGGRPCFRGDYVL
jgi:predicted phosphodiesterase